MKSMQILGTAATVVALVFGSALSEAQPVAKGTSVSARYVRPVSQNAPAAIPAKAATITATPAAAPAVDTSDREIWRHHGVG